MSFLLPACLPARCILPASFRAAHTQPRRSPRVVLSVTDGRHSSVGRSFETGNSETMTLHFLPRGYALTLSRLRFAHLLNDHEITS